MNIINRLIVMCYNFMTKTKICNKLKHIKLFKLAFKKPAVTVIWYSDGNTVVLYLGTD